MPVPRSDRLFDGSIPELYDSLLTPLIFEPYAQDLARRVASEPIGSVLEVGAGTGVVTRAMLDVLGAGQLITATDLNQPMLDHAASIRDDTRITWEQADAQALPYGDNEFDAVVCQFAVMFFPDRAKAYAEARRVLKPGGTLYFNVWDSIEENDFAHAVTESLAGLFPSDPPRFLARTPHGYSNTDQIAADLRDGGFTATAQIETIAARSRAAGPSIPAIAYCQGTPLRSEIKERDGTPLALATDVAAGAIAQRFGSDAVDGQIQAHVVSVRA